MKKMMVGILCAMGALFAHAEGLLVANGPWEMEQTTKPGVTRLVKFRGPMTLDSEKVCNRDF